MEGGGQRLYGQACRVQNGGAGMWGGGLGQHEVGVGGGVRMWGGGARAHVGRVVGGLLGEKLDIVEAVAELEPWRRLQLLDEHVGVW